MKNEKINTIERMSENKTRLLALEKNGNFVFHGSPKDIVALEPRQAHNINKETKKMEKDGEPAVFATSYAEIAIFRSLVNKSNVKESNRSSFN